jgi:hypothetical protein
MHSMKQSPSKAIYLASQQILCLVYNPEVYHHVQLATELPYLHMHKPPFFWQAFTLQNWGAVYTQNIMFFLNQILKKKSR